MTTALGPIDLHRPYCWHPTESGRFLADELLGLDGFLTRQARRLVTLAGIEHSFARARQVLAELCGWDVDDELIRRTTHAEARRVADQRPERADVCAFARAEGAVEVLIDAGKVNTLTGWRDVKFGVFLRRKAGEPATPATGTDAPFRRRRCGRWSPPSKRRRRSAGDCVGNRIG